MVSPKEVTVGYKQKRVNPPVTVGILESSDIVSDKNLATSSGDKEMSL